MQQQAKTAGISNHEHLLRTPTLNKHIGELKSPRGMSVFHVPFQVPFSLGSVQAEWDTTGKLRLFPALFLVVVQCGPQAVGLVALPTPPRLQN